METLDKTTEILNDLLKINNDRIEGYEKAAEETDELYLKTLFRNMADESRKNAVELTREINKLGGEPVADSTTFPGKIYRAWMDVKSTFTGKNKEAILNSCEFGEDAAQAAYNTALSKDEDISFGVRALILEQQRKLKESHDLIKDFRDTSKL